MSTRYCVQWHEHCIVCCLLLSYVFTFFSIWFLVQVGVVNFNPYYRVYDPEHVIQKRRHASNIYQITCPVDVLSSDVQLPDMVSADENYDITLPG